MNLCLSLFPLCWLCHFLTSDFIKMYRQWVPFERNFSYNVIPIFLYFFLTFAHLFLHGLKVCILFAYTCNPHYFLGWGWGPGVTSTSLKFNLNFSLKLYRCFGHGLNIYLHFCIFIKFYFSKHFQSFQIALNPGPVEPRYALQCSVDPDQFASESALLSLSMQIWSTTWI